MIVKKKESMMRNKFYFSSITCRKGGRGRDALEEPKKTVLLWSVYHRRGAPCPVQAGVEKVGRPNNLHIKRGS
jgi:hypothetical protein